jgi:hypothetical protein
MTAVRSGHVKPSVQHTNATSQASSILVKLLYSAFVAIVVPLYWVTYSPWNFLYFCDVALLVTAMAIWIESPLLVSTQAVAIVAMQTLWVIGGEKRGERKGDANLFSRLRIR